MKDYYTYIKTYLIDGSEGFLRYKADLYLCSHQEYYTLLGSEEFIVQKRYLLDVKYDISDMLTDCHNSLIEDIFRRLKINCKRDRLTKKRVKEDYKRNKQDSE